MEKKKGFSVDESYFCLLLEIILNGKLCSKHHFSDIKYY